MKLIKLKYKYVATFIYLYHLPQFIAHSLSQLVLLENAREMRKPEIPFDNIVQDWFYWPKGTKGPEWDRAKYPNPKAMADELKTLKGMT